MLVSLAILAIAVTLVVQLFSANLRAVSRSGDMTTAAVKADSRIREVLAELTPASGSWSEVTGDGYRIDVAVTEVLKEKSESLPFKLLEVSLTVGWREGWRDKRLVLKTLKTVERMAPVEGRPAG